MTRSPALTSSARADAVNSAATRAAQTEMLKDDFIRFSLVSGWPTFHVYSKSGLRSSRDWMGRAKYGNNGKHEQAYCLLHRNAAVERHGVFSVTPGRLCA
jgi:hypothetical protein